MFLQNKSTGCLTTLPHLNPLLPPTRRALLCQLSPNPINDLAAPYNGAVFERTGARIRRSLAFRRDGDGEGAGEGVLRRSEGGQLAGDAVRYEEGAPTTGVSSERGRD